MKRVLEEMKAEKVDAERIPRNAYKKVYTGRSRKSISTKGSIVINHGSFRAQVRIWGYAVTGPARRDRSNAVRDLETAQTAGSELKMRRVLERIKEEAVKRRLDEEPGPSSDAIRRLCEEVVSWQREAKVGYIPKEHSKEDRERKLGMRFRKALRRRFKAAGTKPSRAVLNDDERVMINSIPGVSARRCYTSSGVAVAGEYSNSAVTKRQMEAEPMTDRMSKHRYTKIPMFGDAVDSSERRADRVHLYSATKMPGSVQRNGEYGWRFQVRIDGNDYTGPYRRDKVDAEADMREAKEAPTTEAMKMRIREIKVRLWTIAEATALSAETEADTLEIEPKHQVG
jgi:hypothetical protein